MVRCQRVIPILLYQGRAEEYLNPVMLSGDNVAKQRYSINPQSLQEKAGNAVLLPITAGTYPGASDRTKN